MLSVLVSLKFCGLERFIQILHCQHKMVPLLFLFLGGFLISIPYLNPNKPWVFMCLQVFENIVGKGEIPCKEQFLLVPQCFFFFFLPF